MGRVQKGTPLSICLAKGPSINDVTHLRGEEGWPKCDDSTVRFREWTVTRGKGSQMRKICVTSLMDGP